MVINKHTGLLETPPEIVTRGFLAFRRRRGNSEFRPRSDPENPGKFHARRKIRLERHQGKSSLRSEALPEQANRQAAADSAGHPGSLVCALVDITLRSYKPADFDVLHEIDQVCYEAEIAYSKRELREYLRLRGADCVVAEARRQSVAGFCISAQQDHYGYIVTIDVLAEFRRHKVGHGAARRNRTPADRFRRARSAPGNRNGQRLGGCLLAEAWLS